MYICTCIYAGLYLCTGGGYAVDDLRQVQVPSVNTTWCNSSISYNGVITGNMFCAGLTTGGKDSCQVSLTRHKATALTNVKCLYHCLIQFQLMPRDGALNVANLKHMFLT